MSNPSQFTTIRPLSPLELFSSSRHNLGIYRCVTITCRHALPSPPPSPSAHPIFQALAQLVHDHPMLRVGIDGQETPAAEWTHIPSVDLRNHVEFQTVEGGEGYEAAVTGVHAWCGDQFWGEIETCPPWRVIVITPETQDKDNCIEDIVFAFHHSLMDGTSGKNFHSHLLKALNSLPPSPTLTENDYILNFPDLPTLPESQDDVIPFRNGLLFLLHTLYSEFCPSYLQPTRSPIWGGQLIDFSHPHHMRVKPVDIPHEVVETLLRECRAHETSITALIHALCLATFATHVDLEPGIGFTSSTPVNLRPYLSPTANPSTRDTLRILITSMDHQFPASSITPFSFPTADTTTLIWNAAHAIKTAILARTSTLPANDPVSLAKHVTWSPDYWRNKDKTPRAATWEVSSIGTVDNTPGGRSITRILFSNGAMIAGPAVGVNVASVKGGVLTVGISWNEGVVEDELVDGLAENLARFTRTLHECGRFKE